MYSINLKYYLKYDLKYEPQVWTSSMIFKYDLEHLPETLSLNT